MSKIWRWLLVVVVLLGLSGCGGGTNTEEVVSNTIPQKTTVKVDVKGLGIANISEYTLLSSEQEIRISKIDKIDIDKDTKDIVVLMDKGGQPILMGRKFSGDTDVVISLVSSAEIFVLYHPRFNGVSVNEPKKLSNAIRSNKKFPKLMEAIKKAINNDNPCPMNPTCNFEARDIAIDIANDLDIDSLYNKTGKK